jgi:hypothetical protein
MLKLSSNSKSVSLDNLLSPNGLKNTVPPPPSPGSLPFSPRPTHNSVEVQVTEAEDESNEVPVISSGMQPIGIGCLLKSGQILVFIDSNCRDQGYGYEVLKILLRHGFSSECDCSEQNSETSPDLNAVMSQLPNDEPRKEGLAFLWVQWTTEENSGAAQRLSEKLGMRRVGQNTWGLTRAEFEELWGDLAC